MNQRARLAGKAHGGAGGDVHLLLLTATPIPRTLALTLYGDLEVSILDASPPGRGDVRTRWVQGDDRRKIPAFLAERLAAGEQVCLRGRPRARGLPARSRSATAPVASTASAYPVKMRARGVRRSGSRSGTCCRHV